jgi:hypothetical protein
MMSDAGDPSVKQARDAGASSGIDAGHASPLPEHDAGAADAASGDARGDMDGGSPIAVPAALVAFGNEVAQASKQGMWPQGPIECAAALPAVQVASASEANAAARAYVASMFGVPASALTEEAQACGDSTHASCADIFNNDASHFGGQVPATIYPLAQRVDAEATSEQLTLFTLDTDLTHRVVVVLIGQKAGWLTGIAFFGDRGDCSSPE